MLSDIKGITIAGANFNELTQLPILIKNWHSDQSQIAANCTLIYGRNGSGKSTISRAFSKVLGVNEENITYVELWDKDDNKLNLPDEEKKQIFVFNEDYVDANVKTKQKGLNTIIILGKQVDLDNKIDTLEKNIKDIFEKETIQRDICDKYEDQNNVKSPKYWKKQIDKNLKGDTNWAGRDSSLDSKHKTNTRVTNNTYKRFINLKPSLSRDELLKKFYELEKEKKNIDSGKNKLTKGIPDIKFLNNYLNFQDQELNILLLKKIIKPHLSEREKKIIALLNDKGANEIINRINVFKDSNLHNCPYCYQKLDTTYKQNLIKSLESVLNQEVQNYQSQLKKFDEIPSCELKLDTSLSVLNNYKECDFLLHELNEQIKHCNELIKKKIANPYEIITKNNCEIGKLAKNLYNQLQNLKKDYVEYNDQANDTTSIVKSLHEINDQIAYYDIKDAVSNFNISIKDSQEANKLLQQYLSIHKKYNKKKKQLEGQKRNIRIAVNSINSFLRYIFGTNHRLQLELDDENKNEYKLISRDKEVNPNEISEGERNILGLCYFFTKLLEEKEIDKAYSKESLLVIDDPVSSFDEENRIGILSFLKFQLDKLWGGNRRSRVIFMTHDAQTFFDLSKIYKELKNKYKGSWGKVRCIEFRLENERLTEINIQKYNRYNFCIEQVYKFACGEGKEYEPIIGNLIRQVMEAFSTFKYQMGIAQLSCDKKILSELDPAYQSYFYNLMYKLVLNDDSHLKDNVNTMDNLNFFAIKSIEEKEKIARDILCFIYQLDNLHFEYHVENIKDSKGTKIVDMEKIKEWCNDITNCTLPKLN